MAMITPATLVEGVARQPLPYGLFSTFTWRPEGADRWEGGGVEFESPGCDPVQGIGPWQCAEGTTEGLPKTLTAITGAIGADGEATPFTVYGHFTCSPVGWTPEQAQARATEQLLTREEAGVEEAFWTGSLGSVGPLGNLPILQDATATDLSVASAGPAETLGLLENWIASEFGSVGVIHVTRQTALVALGLGLLETSAGRLYTRLGTPVAAGAGYPGSSPAGVAAAASTAWAFATPPLFGYRSVVITSSARAGDLLDRGSNDLYAVAERSYLLGFDPCAGIAAALVTLTAV